MDRLYDVLNTYCDRVVELYKQKAIESGKTASYELVNTAGARVFKYKRNELGQFAPFNDSFLDTNYEIRIQLQDYAWNIEFGRKPGKFPPVDAIRRWVEQKPIIPKPMQLRNALGQFTSRIVTPTPNQLAFLIGRKIAEEGIEPTPLLQETIDELQDELLTAIRQAVGEDFKGFISSIFGK